MSKRKTQEELSAYLDGEAKDPARIEAVLSGSRDAAADLDAMGRMSERVRALAATEVHSTFAESVVARIESECGEELAAARLAGQFKSLPEPDVHPAFARRVVAAIESERSERATPWRIRVPGTALAAAAAVIIAVAVYNNGPAPAPERTEIIASQPAETTAAPTVLDEAALLAQFESRVASDRDVQQIVMARFEPTAQPADLYSERLLTAFSNSSGQTTTDAFIRGADYRSVLRQMDRDQTNAVKQLLEASVKEAHEG